MPRPRKRPPKRACKPHDLVSFLSSPKSIHPPFPPFPQPQNLFIDYVSGNSGFCSREQNYRPEDCQVCHSVLVAKKGSGFWEGGKGTRDKARMSRKGTRAFFASFFHISSRISPSYFLYTYILYPLFLYPPTSPTPCLPANIISTYLILAPPAPNISHKPNRPPKIQACQRDQTCRWPRRRKSQTELVWGGHRGLFCVCFFCFFQALESR